MGRRKKELPEQPLSLAETDPIEAYQLAKKMWFSGESREFIRQRTGWPLHKLNEWIYGYGSEKMPEGDEKGWKVLREKMETKIVSEAFRTEKDRYHRLMVKCLETLERGVNHLAVSNAELSSKDISALTVAARALHEIYQLESGKPTSITAQTKLTRKEILEKLKQNDIISYGEDVITEKKIVN